MAPCLGQCLSPLYLTPNLELTDQCSGLNRSFGANDCTHTAKITTLYINHSKRHLPIEAQIGIMPA